MNILNLIRDVSIEEGEISSEFISPTIAIDTQKVSIRVCGMIRSFILKNNKIEGWNVLRGKQTSAEIIREASIYEINSFTESVKNFKMILISKVRESSWLAYPSHTESFEKAGFEIKPYLIHLVKNGSTFDEVYSCFAGSFWYIDHTGLDYLIKENIDFSLKSLVLPENLKIKDLPRSYRTVYEIVFSKLENSTPEKIAEKKINNILNLTKGKMVKLSEHSKDSWSVQWKDSRGKLVITQITKKDFRVNSAGYCLSGDDAKFDFQAVAGLRQTYYDTHEYY